ncbi:MAG: M15 family metallopeptidase [bacterium]
MRFLLKIKMVTVIALLFFLQNIHAQTVKENPYRLKIISTIQSYDSLVHSDSLKKLVELVQVVPAIRLDIRYASTDNFTHARIYASARAFTRLPVARALAQVQKDLEKKGLGLKVFDAYRPYTATLLFYNVMHDTVFVAAPWKGSRHNRGCAVDLSLTDLKSGKELEMPTPYDDFTKKASPTWMDLPEKALKNRKILIDVMNARGFTVYPDEWWHFDFKGWEDYELMDLTFEELDE